MCFLHYGDKEFRFAQGRQYECIIFRKHFNCTLISGLWNKQSTAVLGTPGDSGKRIKCCVNASAAVYPSYSSTHTLTHAQPELGLRDSGTCRAIFWGGACAWGVVRLTNLLHLSCLCLLAFINLMPSQDLKRFFLFLFFNATAVLMGLFNVYKWHPALKCLMKIDASTRQALCRLCRLVMWRLLASDFNFL